MWRACAPKAIPPLDGAGQRAYKAAMMTRTAIIIRITCPALWSDRAAGTRRM